MSSNFDLHKQELINKARAEAQINQFSDANFDSSHTKLGPSLNSYGKWRSASWAELFPLYPGYIKKFDELGEKYKDVKWLPLALPKFELPHDQFLEIWEREKIPIIDTLNPPDSPEFYGLHITSNSRIDFNLHDIYSDGKMTTGIDSMESGYQQGRHSVGRYTKKLYKHKFWFDLISQVMDLFPIYMLSNIMILETNTPVAPHREQTWTWKCPTEFRVMLHDENIEPTVYVSDIATGETNYIDLPSDTNSFCWSNGTQVYGIDYHGKKSYQMVVSAIWNSSKLDKLAEDSINKYRDQLNYKL